MKLYHGTSERHLKAIRKHGLRPRGKRKTNWEANPSFPLAVYLTNSYACFYAMAACKGRERWAVLEIDTGKLEPFDFAPDEDFLEQIGRGRNGGPPKDGIPGDMYERTATLKTKLLGYAGSIDSDPVALSLKHLGNCTYLGDIPNSAITRVALVDTKAAQDFVFRVFDPTITLMNYAICGASYRNSLRWLFGYDLEPDQIALFKAPDSRSGITIQAWDADQAKQAS